MRCMFLYISEWIALLMKNYEQLKEVGAKIFMGTSDFAIEDEWLQGAKGILDFINKY